MALVHTGYEYAKIIFAIVVRKGLDTIACKAGHERIRFRRLLKVNAFAFATIRRAVLQGCSKRKPHETGSYRIVRKSPLRSHPPCIATGTSRSSHWAAREKIRQCNWQAKVESIPVGVPLGGAGPGNLCKNRSWGQCPYCRIPC